MDFIEFSVNPASILNELLKINDRSKEKVALYVESIAVEADSLAKVWEEIVAQLISTGKAEIDHQKIELEKYRGRNAPYYTALIEFYGYLSVAVGGKLEDRWHNTLASHLGMLLHQRELTMQEYIKYISNLSDNVLFLDKNNKSANLKNLLESVTALQKEAAKIRVLAKTIKSL